MRTTSLAAIILFASQTLFAADQPPAPPSPPAVTYDVWGFQWDGQRYVKQPIHSLSTSDLQQAVEYAKQVTGVAGWAVTTNLPEACVVHTLYHAPRFTRARPADFPAKPTFAVWAYKSTGGQWVKDDAWGWTTPDPQQAADYVAKINAVSGWRATTNCPPVIPREQRYVDGGIVRGANQYAAWPLRTSEVLYNPIVPRVRQNVMIQFGGFQIVVPVDVANASSSSDVGSSSPNISSPSYDYSNDIQNMLNTQNMINTQNMVNNIQDMINTQNAVNMQNMINSMSP